MSGTDSPVNDESGGLGEQSKLLALGVAVMYAAGLFATNAFLRQHEISDFSLLRPKALFTGALVVGSLGIIAFVPLHVVADLIDRRQNSIAITTRFLGTFAIRLLAPWILLAAVLWISAADDSSPLFDSFFGERRKSTELLLEESREPVALSQRFQGSGWLLLSSSAACQSGQQQRAAERKQ